MVAILNDPNTPEKGPSLLLQKQFRPALGKVTIEVPSGLIDAGESPSAAAIRELREETGYIGTIAPDIAAAEGFIMHNDPGFCNTNTKMVVVEVDMADPRNQTPRPELEEGEFIETFTLPLRTLWADLTRLDAEGYAVDARVGGLAQGMEMARRWKEALAEEAS
jgi:ADP-ribose pyrophosphatase